MVKNQFSDQLKDGALSEQDEKEGDQGSENDNPSGVHQLLSTSQEAIDMDRPSQDEGSEARHMEED